MKNMSKYFVDARSIITVCFDYNGDLGVLQQKTKDNLETINRLQFEHVISYEDAKEVREDCKNYFKEEIQKVLDSLVRFIDF